MRWARAFLEIQDVALETFTCKKYPTCFLNPNEKHQAWYSAFLKMLCLWYNSFLSCQSIFEYYACTWKKLRYPCFTYLPLPISSAQLFRIILMHSHFLLWMFYYEKIYPIVMMTLIMQLGNENKPLHCMKTLHNNVWINWNCWNHFNKK